MNILSRLDSGFTAAIRTRESFACRAEIAERAARQAFGRPPGYVYKSLGCKVWVAPAEARRWAGSVKNYNLQDRLAGRMAGAISAVAREGRSADGAVKAAGVTATLPLRSCDGSAPYRMAPYEIGNMLSPAGESGSPPPEFTTEIEPPPLNQAAANALAN